jgi:hypothetical protein
MIGMLPSVLEPVPRCSRKLSSPACPAGALTWKFADCPGRSVRDAGNTEPTFRNCWVA